MTKDEALRLALEAMESFQNGTNGLYEGEFEEEITAIKAALEAKDEPVAWGYRDRNGEITDCITPHEHARAEGDYRIPLYTTPPQRKPLTLEQLREHWQVAKVFDMTYAEIDIADYVLIARDVEALHSIKGEA